MDIRRTILWMILTFSLLLLWNNWQTYNGKPSMFGSSMTSQTVDPAVQAQQEAQPTADTSIPSATAPPAAPATMPGDPAPAAATQSQHVECNTAVLHLTFDTKGAQLVRAVLPKYATSSDDSQPLALLDRRPGYTYVAQTGVVGAPAGQSFPTHLTPFRYVGEQQAADGRTALRFEAESGDMRVVKTYYMAPHRYDIRVTHEIQNLGSAPIQPSVYLQLERDGNKPSDGSSFYSTFSGPAVYTSEDKYQKIDFS